MNIGKAATKTRRRNGNSGHAIVEVALMSPWIFLLFIGIFDFGFYAYSLTSVANAARGAALHTSSDPAAAADTQGACDLVKLEMDSMLNKAQFSASCSALPLVVTATALVGPDGAQASRVTVQYETVQLMPIPGLDGKFTFNRSVTMRVQ
jgi:Flp pilus assembly protein TadG